MSKKILINSKEFEYDLKSQGEQIIVTLDGNEFLIPKSALNIPNNGKHFVLNNCDYFIEKVGRKGGATGSDQGAVSPMPGKILKVLVKVGDSVKAGTPLVIMEAMKMEHTLKASKDSTIKSIKYAEGDLVDGQVELVELED